MRKLLYGCALLVVACSSPSPEAQPPVELQPGSYDVTLGGSTMVELRSGERHGEVCLSSDFKNAPLAELTPGWEDCSDEQVEPRGNALVGKRTCDRKTPVLVEYRGSHTTDSFEIKGTVSQGSDESDMAMRLGSGEFSISGKRKGDC